MRMHSLKKRTFLHLFIPLLMVSWLSMLISNTCMMPASTFETSASPMPAGCAEMDPSASYQDKITGMPHQDCAFKPCLDSHPNPAFEIKVDKPQTPIFVLCLLGLTGYFFHSILFISRTPPRSVPPIGRRILLIYRFCTLLN
jgi:hypothetical protein